MDVQAHASTPAATRAAALPAVGGVGALSRPAARASAEAGAVSVCVRGVTKQYGATRALSRVTVDARAGEALALWGANGAGKTTLIKAMLGLIDFEGAIDVLGYDVKRAGKIARRRIGYVPQDGVFNDWDVRSTLEFYARLKSVPVAHVAQTLQATALQAHAGKPVTALSGGLKQRLALAIALLADPPVLLLDEPMSSLDRQARAEYLALLRSLRSAGKTIIFASHRLEEVAALADRVLVLEQGVLVETLTPAQLRARWMEEVEPLWN